MATPAMWGMTPECPPRIDGDRSARRLTESMTVLDARYELGRRIGRGGMAVVVEGYDRKLERHVAVKLLRDGLGDARSSERFVREARLAGRPRPPQRGRRLRRRGEAGAGRTS